MNLSSCILYRVGYCAHHGEVSRGHGDNFRRVRGSEGLPERVATTTRHYYHFKRKMTHLELKTVLNFFLDKVNNNKEEFYFLV